MKFFMIIIALVLPLLGITQNYTSYFTGSSQNITTNPTGGICMMGGRGEHDDAMRWFLQRADGGDVLVLRASGSDGYNNYFYSQLGVTINSVETIVVHNAQASYEDYIHNKINNAEAIWFAGGDQWNYVNYWRGTPIATLINQAIAERNIVIGGTSAGMAILGGYYFTAQNGTITSNEALNNPYHSKMRLSAAPFLDIPILSNVVTDSHFNNPNRKGRTVTFMARALQDDGFSLKAITCNEYTAVCIEPGGLARVFGSPQPQHDDYAYFLQPNCELSDYRPETCVANSPLTWNHNSNAVRVYKIKGNNTGSNTFDLSDWATGNGGVWERWSVTNGVLSENPSEQINCITSIIDLDNNDKVFIFPNPAGIFFNISAEQIVRKIVIIDEQLRVVWTSFPNSKQEQIPLAKVPSGIYFVKILFDNKLEVKKLVKI